MDEERRDTATAGGLEALGDAVAVVVRRFVCWAGVHGPLDTTGFDGMSLHVRCSWCQREGMLDSQGNLF